MLFSYSWLKEYLENIPEPKELADRLTMSGTEIESVTRTGAQFTNVFTAEVLECGKHPNADKLSLCRVKTDKNEYSIVCGAKNMKPGDKVALALEGADLPNGIKIKRSKIRGVESQGMMCSEVELGLKDTSDGILILPPDTPLGLDYSSILGSDFMMEAGVTPNRADLLSIRGIAREVSAVTDARFIDKDALIDEGENPVSSFASVEIDPEAPCRRYAARVIEGVTIGESPDEIKRRLEAHGLRPVNNVVDLTNLILLETGQPLHAFDLDKLNGGKIIVRLAKDGESIETIDGKTRKLEPSMLVIADALVPVAVAGVMGGKGTEVSGSTKNILLESAWFEPSSVRRTSRKLGLSSDSSYRFERGVDIDGIARALDTAAHLINKLAGGWVARGTIDLYPVKFQPHPIEFRVKRAEDLLGIRLKEEEVLRIFRKLGIGEEAEAPGVIRAYPPTYRGDITHETDLVEEVARIFGYDNIPATLPVARLLPGSPGKLSGIRGKVKEILVNSGFFEVVNYSFISKDNFSLAGPAEKQGVTVLNPITEDQVVMRDSLLPSLLENLKFNISRKNEQVRIFEFAPAFISNGKLPQEKWKASGLMYGSRYGEGWNSPKEPVDFFDIKGVMERLLEGVGIASGFEFVPGGFALLHPGKAALLKVGNRPAGVLGEVHPDLMEKFDLKRPAYLFELDIDAIIDMFGGTRKYRQLPRFPESARDIAFISEDGILFSEIISSIERLDTKLIERVELFDVYCGSNIPQGRRSLAVRVTYRSKEGTLTAQEVDDIHSRVIKELVDRFKAEIRGE